MAAYVIADVGVKKPEIYAEYRKQVLATVEKHGGRFLVRGGGQEILEGQWNDRVVVLEFPDKAAAQRWYRSKEYGPLIKLRQSASEGRLVLVEGV